MTEDVSGSVIFDNTPHGACTDVLCPAVILARVLGRHWERAIDLKIATTNHKQEEDPPLVYGLSQSSHSKRIGTMLGDAAKVSGISILWYTSTAHDVSESIQIWRVQMVG